MRYLRKRTTQTGIDISPLIDMVFILLIFFMVSTTFVKEMKLEIERPGAASAERASTKSIRIHVERSGALYLDGQPVKPWMLQSRVRDLIKGGSSGQILVITDRLVPAEQLVNVLDQCRLGGATDVGVATEKEAG
jgi:biopolymer transport protein ExbD